MEKLRKEIKELPGDNEKIKYDERTYAATVKIADDGYNYIATVEYALESKSSDLLATYNYHC